MILNNIKLGADPELFLINTETNETISAIGIIPGEKGKPYRSKDMPKGYGLEIDNILAEFNIPPASTRKEWVDSMNYMKDYIRKYVKNINPNYDIKCASSSMIDKKYLNNAIACLFGCSPDYNAYTMSQNPAPKGDKTNIRSAGTHIHVSYDNPNIDASVSLVQYMDFFVGIPSILIDQDAVRRSLYGKAGSFRLCSYGVEYRVLSGLFIDKDEYIEFMWDKTMNAIKAFNDNTPILNSDIVQNIINNCDVEEATYVCKKYKLV